MAKKETKKEIASQARNDKSPFKDAIQNLPFVNFQETPEFIGLYKNTLRLGDKEDQQFDVNVMIDVETGEEMFVTDSYSIRKAIQKAKAEYPDGIADIVFKIKFIEKTMLDGGHQFNKYNIGFCTLEAYEAFKEAK